MSTFIYIQKADTGLAPCVHNRIWSLALCKPTIRRCARAGDYVLAVTSCDDGHRLSSWAKIKVRISTKAFSKDSPTARADNIYTLRPNGKFARRKNVKHKLHNSKADLDHDLGKDGKNAWVLISTDFFTFGKRALELPAWTRGLPHLADEITKLGRAFRRNHDQTIENDLRKLERILKTTFRRFHNKNFKPRDPGLEQPPESRGEEKQFTCIHCKFR